MTTKEILLILILFFICGFVASEVTDFGLTTTATIPFLSMVGAFLGIIFIRIKHIDDLNLSRKKDTALDLIKYVSEYRNVMISITDANIKPDDLHSSLLEASKNMVGALDKFHVISDDRISNKIELKNYEITSLMISMFRKSAEFGDDKIGLLKWLLANDVLSNLNIIRYEIIQLISSEIGDGSGTDLLKKAIDKNNQDFKQLFTDVLE